MYNIFFVFFIFHILYVEIDSENLAVKRNIYTEKHEVRMFNRLRLNILATVYRKDKGGVQCETAEKFQNIIFEMHRLRQHHAYPTTVRTVPGKEPHQDDVLLQMRYGTRFSGER